MTSVPGLPTVSWLELAWVVMALVACVFSFRTRRKWALVARNLTAADDAGARAIAGMIDWSCRGLVAASVIEVLISLPSLSLPSRTDVSWVTLVIVPGLSFCFSGGITGLSLYLHVQTNRIGRGRYTGPERRVAVLSTYAGPERRRTAAPSVPTAPAQTRDGALDGA